MIKKPRSILDVYKIIQRHFRTIYIIILTMEKGKAYLQTSYQNNYNEKNVNLFTIHYKG